MHEFWDTYNKIYETVAKWSKKAKHAVFCYDLLWKMVGVCASGRVTVPFPLSCVNAMLCMMCDVMYDVM